MDDRERLANYLRFGEVDRPPRWEWAFRPGTTALWYEQGLPSTVPEEIRWDEYFKLDRGAACMAHLPPTRLGVNLYPLPDFSQEVVEETDKYVIKKNEWGAVGRWIKKGVQSIPQFISFGVQNREDFLQCKRRLDPLEPKRYPSNWEQLKQGWKERDYPVCLWTLGWYAVLREMMGVEELSVSFYDQPKLLEEICEFWTDFTIKVFARALEEVEVDYVLFWEDLAFKTSSLVSPSHFKHFFVKHYQRVLDYFRSKGIENFMVDSDGNIEEIIPLWLDVGVNILGPFEVAADMDVVKTGREYKELIMVGGIDKREIARGSKAIETEVLRRVVPLVERRGFLPTLDHSTIPELSLADFRYYREFLEKVWEK